jgi:hypothetical protein
VLEHVFVQPLKVILHHDLAADNSGLIDAALFGHRKSPLPVADGGSFLVLVWNAPNQAASRSVFWYVAGFAAIKLRRYPGCL